VLKCWKCIRGHAKLSTLSYSTIRFFQMLYLVTVAKNKKYLNGQKAPLSICTSDIIEMELQESYCTYD